MARKKSEHETEPETEPVDVSPFADSLEASAEKDPSFLDEMTTAPEVAQSETLSLFIEGEDMQMVSFALPKAVLYALLDPNYEGSDVRRAVYLGLLSAVVDGGPTELGQRILNGTDVIALNHKINTAYRTAHNRAVGPSRIVRA